MPHLDTNFGDVPDEFEQIPPGTYLLEVKAAPQIMPTNDGKSTKMVVEFAVVEDPKLNGRNLQDHISMKMLTRIKRVFLAAGLKPGAAGIDTEELVGRRVKAIVIHNTYRDKDSGEERESARIKDYVVEPTSA